MTRRLVPVLSKVQNLSILWKVLKLTSILFLGRVDLRLLGLSEGGTGTGWPSDIRTGLSKPGKHMIARNQWALK